MKNVFLSLSRRPCKTNVIPVNHPKLFLIPFYLKPDTNHFVIHIVNDELLVLPTLKDHNIINVYQQPYENKQIQKREGLFVQNLCKVYTWYSMARGQYKNYYMLNHDACNCIIGKIFTILFRTMARKTANNIFRINLNNLNTSIIFTCLTLLNS